MPGISLTRNAAVDRVSNAVAAGVTAINSSSVDMEGFEVCTFLTAFGAITASAVTFTQIDHSADNSSWNTVLGSRANIAVADANEIAINECVRPTLRYLRLTVNRTVANSVVDSITAIRTQCRKSPVTQGATISGATVIVGSTTGTP